MLLARALFYFTALIFGTLTRQPPLYYACVMVIFVLWTALDALLTLRRIRQNEAELRSFAERYWRLIRPPAQEE